MKRVEPLNVAGLFPGLHAGLMTLLRGLRAEDWSRPTWAPRWLVRDVVAHLLDGELRRLSFQRDRLDPPSPVGAINGYHDLVGYLDDLNAQWVSVARRMSPRVLMDLLDVTGPQVSDLVAALDPRAPALFAVAWAGEALSETWFDIGREYTERWHHQQQIRDAVGAPGLTGREWLFPVIDISVRALPHTYRRIHARSGEVVTIEITGEAGGVWSLVREPEEWILVTDAAPDPVCRVTLDDDTAWKAFFRAAPREELARRMTISGSRPLAEPVLDVAAVMV